MGVDGNVARMLWSIMRLLGSAGDLYGAKLISSTIRDTLTLWHPSINTTCAECGYESPGKTKHYPWCMKDADAEADLLETWGATVEEALRQVKGARGEVGS